MTVYEVLCLCALNVLSLVIGVAIGQKVVRQEKIEINPVKAVKNTITEHKETKKKEEEDKYMEALMHNIDNYDGTGAMQRDLPRK